MNQEKKFELIKELNRSYRTILSYGNNGLVPVGEFIVTDITIDEIPEEYSNIISPNEIAEITLTNINDEKSIIKMPVKIFLSLYSEKAQKNADILDVGSNISNDIEYARLTLEKKLISDELLSNLKVELLTLEEREADYFTNDNDLRSMNYSICPVDIGKYIERIRTKSYEDESKKKMEEKDNKVCNYHAFNNYY